MIESKVLKLLNDQFNLEVHSSLVYINLSTIAEDMGLKNFAKFLKKQSDEEMEHAEKIRQFCIERQETPFLSEIKIKPIVAKNVMDIAKAGLSHEKIVTSSIHEIYKNSGNDVATQIFLNWFILEQVEEEDQFEDIIKLIENTNDLITFDNEIAKRYIK